jgi:LDH2 family malate/lactate/ureidoglycolate dehydrogenase
MDNETKSPDRAFGYGNEQRTYGQWWDWRGEWTRVSVSGLKRLYEDCLIAAGLPPALAPERADDALEKTLQGDYARGLVYFPGRVRAIQALVAAGEPAEGTIEVVRDNGATALVTGTGSINLFAMELAIEKARRYGIGLVGAQQPGKILAPYVKLAADAGMVGLVMTQTKPNSAPFGGYVPMLGNGPFAVGIPVAGRDPVIVDMSFTQSSASGVLLAASQGEQIPPGLLLDEHGEPTTDARALSRENHEKAVTMRVSGSLTPLGGGHKGYAMLFTIGALCSTLTDTDFPWDLDGAPAERRFGTLHFAINPEFISGQSLPDRMSTFVETLAASPRRTGVDRILYPGQRSQELRRERRERDWVDVPKPHLQATCDVAKELGVTTPPDLVINT